jgi:hypothetical protein
MLSKVVDNTSLLMSVVVAIAETAEEIQGQAVTVVVVKVVEDVVVITVAERETKTISRYFKDR